MEKLTFESSAGSVELGRSAPYILTELNGVGAVDTDTQMQKAAYQDGKTYIDTLLEPREVEISVVILAEDPQEVFALRRELSRVMNPKLGEGMLIYQTPTQDRRIKAVVEALPQFPSGGDNKGRKFQRAILTLRCPSPFWQDVEKTGEKLGFIEGGLIFPLLLNPDVQEHTLFGRRGFTALLNNEGDVPAPVKIVFSGPAENPKIINKSTGEFIQINETLASDEKLIINTAFGHKRAEIEGSNGEMQNAFHYLDLESTFWQLAVGENEIDYESDISREEASVRITYRNRYVGI